jgi:hypothetical protein
LTLRDGRDNKIGAFYVEESDMDLPVSEVIKQIYDATARRERIEFKAKRANLAVHAYAKVCFEILAPPPPPQTLKEPIPFSVYVDQWSV